MAFKFGGSTTKLNARIFTYSANPPSIVWPMPRPFRHRCSFPERQRSQKPHASVSIDATERRSRAVLRLSKESPRADQIYRQILEGTISNISVGYYPLSMEKTDREIDGRAVHVVDRWSPREISVVAIPADWKGSGVGRSQNNKEIGRAHV